MLQNESTPLLKMQGTRVRISWTVSSGIPTWNDTCAWAIEKFGLPGDNFNTHCTEDYMDLIFKDEKDAIHFALRWL
jgi:hypothetical protein